MFLLVTKVTKFQGQKRAFKRPLELVLKKPPTTIWWSDWHRLRRASISYPRFKRPLTTTGSGSISHKCSLTFQTWETATGITSGYQHASTKAFMVVVTELQVIPLISTQSEDTLMNSWVKSPTEVFAGRLLHINTGQILIHQCALHVFKTFWIIFLL